MTMPETEVLEAATDLELLAYVLTGLQVPLSINGPAMLGASYEPYTMLKKRMRDTGIGIPIGWQSAEDFRAWLVHAITTKVATPPSIVSKPHYFVKSSHSLSEVEKWAVEQLDGEPFDKNFFCDYVFKHDKTNGVVLCIGYDGGEPEDNTLTRDFLFLIEELNK